MVEVVDRVKDLTGWRGWRERTWWSGWRKFVMVKWVERVTGSKVGCWGRVVVEGRLIREERGYRPLGWSWAIVPQTA